MMRVAQPSPRKATALQVVKAVRSAFVGIRRRAAHEHDAVSLMPLQVIVARAIGAAILVASLVLLVRVVTG